MPKIPEHIIDQVRDAADIVSVISHYISLKKQGKNFVSLCPFHTEKTPSFTISPDKQIFYCFGCGAGGNVFSFLMKYEKVTFLEAVQKLAAEVGITLPKYKEDEKKVSEYERSYRAHQFACNFFVKNLEDQFSHLKNYLTKRNIKIDTLKTFQIGYVKDIWDSLHQEVMRKKMDLNIFLSSGLLLKSEKDPTRIYDRFRNRLIFPIHNLSGRIVAFGGRSLIENQNIPKYINSSESPIYIKSEILYGLFFTKEWIRQEDYAIIVEGYMDFIQLYQNGIKNVAATSGTALSENHAKLLRRFTKNIILCFDSDFAGINAALRGGQILFQENLDVRVLILPENEDPDSYVKKNGAPHFFALLKTAQDYFDFKAERLTMSFKGDNVSQQTKIVAELLETLAHHRDPLKRNFYINIIAQKYGLHENTLLEELNKKRRRLIARETEINAQVKTTATPFIASETLTGAWSAEKDVLIILINHIKDVKNFIFKILEDEDFLNEDFQSIYKLIRKNRNKTPDDLIHLVISNIKNDQIIGILTADLLGKIHDPERYLNDCIHRIKITRFQNQIDILRKKLNQLKPESPEFPELLEKINQNLIHIKEIRKFFKADNNR